MNKSNGESNMHTKSILRKYLLATTALVLGAVAANASAGFYSIEEVKPLWVKMDLNGDGFVSWEEVMAQEPRMIKRFYRADYNRDGKLDLREFEELLISL